MALAKIDAYGAPSYGPLHGTEGCVFHTPENEGPSLADALATARWQATESNTSGGSYHGILGWDSSRGPMSNPDAWVLVKTVPFGQIAGSISTRRDAVWQPGRFPFLQQLLSPAAYADPNAYLHALCLSGRAAWWSEQLSTSTGRAKVQGAILQLARWVYRLEQLFGYDSVLNLHRMWQTNRTDPGPLSFADLVLDAYKDIPSSTVPQPSTTDLQDTVRRLRSRLQGKDEAMAAAVDHVKGAQAQLRAALAELTDAQEL